MCQAVRGKSLFGLDIGLPVERLREPILDCLKGDLNRREMTLKARNRRGQDIQCRLSFNPLEGNGLQVRGVILLMEVMV